MEEEADCVPTRDHRSETDKRTSVIATALHRIIQGHGPKVRRALLELLTAADVADIADAPGRRAYIH